MIERHVADKIKFNTLFEVTKSFLASISESKMAEVLKFSRVYEDSLHDFQYEGKWWTGNIIKQYSPYAHVQTEFINFKLPNDSFIYTPIYGVGRDDLIENQDTYPLIHLLGHVVAKIPDFAPTLRMNYKEMEGRLEFYFEDKPKAQTVTFKYEYGTYKYFDTSLKKTYSNEELRKLLNLWFCK